MVFSAGPVEPFHEAVEAKKFGADQENDAVIVVAIQSADEPVRPYLAAALLPVQHLQFRQAGGKTGLHASKSCPGWIG